MTDRSASLRVVPSDLDPAVVAAIDSRLDVIARDVAIPLAVESGSRAWGFPSPDSDYDCRFVYVRPRHDYLSLWPRRDVIETPLDRVLDVNGWDLAKALRLATGGNAVLIEWLRSPIVYRGEPWFRDALDRFCVEHAPLDRVRAHYLHLGLRQRARAVDEGGDASVKKLFYLLRPALALRWMRLNAGLPPMDLRTLTRAGELPVTLAQLIDELVARKAVTRELGREPAPIELLRFADAEFADIRSADRNRTASAPARAAADELFRLAIQRFDPSGAA